MGAAIEFPNCRVWDLAQFERVIPIAAGVALRNVGLRPMTQVLERNEYVAPLSVKGYSTWGGATGRRFRSIRPSRSIPCRVSVKDLSRNLLHCRLQLTRPQRSVSEEMNTGAPPFRGQELDDILRLQDATFSGPPSDAFLLCVLCTFTGRTKPKGLRLTAIWS